MNKAQQLATDIEEGNFSLRDLHQAAALLRQQDEAVRVALGLINEYMEHSFIEANNAAIAKIKKVLHD